MRVSIRAPRQEGDHSPGSTRRPYRPVSIHAPGRGDSLKHLSEASIGSFRSTLPHGATLPPSLIPGLRWVRCTPRKGLPCQSYRTPFAAVVSIHARSVRGDRQVVGVRGGCGSNDLSVLSRPPPRRRLAFRIGQAQHDSRNRTERAGRCRVVHRQSSSSRRLPPGRQQPD